MRRLALLAVLTLTGCTTLVPPPVPTERPVDKEPVRTARVQRGDISGVLTLSGEVRVKGQQTLTAKVSGRLDKLSVGVGTTVQEGQSLAEIDPSSFEMRVAQGEASLAAAEAKLAGLLAGKPDDQALGEAVLRGAKARLEALEKAPQGDSPQQLLTNLQNARQRVAQLEASAAQATVLADLAVNATRARADELQRGPNTPQNQAALNDARQEQRKAEDAAAQSRLASNSADLARARQELTNAQDSLILSRNSVGQADLDAARAAVQVADLQLKRASQPASDVDRQAAQAAVQRAQAELAVARLEARESTIVAPFSGLVAETFVGPGALVAPGSPLLTVVPPSFEVVVGLPEAQLGQVAAGQPVKLAVDAFPGQEFTGAVLTIAPAIDARTRTVAVRVEMADPGFKLKAGMFAQLAISSPPKQAVLLVPREALVGRGGDSSVFQVIDGRARRQPIQTGAVDGRNVEVLAGLAEGAEVVVSAAGQADGAAVR